MFNKMKSFFVYVGITFASKLNDQMIFASFPASSQEVSGQDNDNQTSEDSSDDDRDDVALLWRPLCRRRDVEGWKCEVRSRG
jgi:hypothetical protein